MGNYAVVRTDLMLGTDARSRLVSVKYMGSGTTATAIENGNVVKLDGKLVNGTGATAVTEREVYKGVTPTAGTDLKEVVLIASPEVMYDDLKKDLSDFRNEAGDIARGYRFHSGEVFSATAAAFTGTPAKGSIIELQAGTKMKAVSSATSGSTAIGKCIDVEVVGPYTYYVIEVA